VSFVKMTEEDWDKVLRVHLFGSMYVTKAAWPLLREGGYGRVVFTTSAAGLYGNFGQANYSSAKLGIVGLGKTLAHEGAKYNIKSNVIAPIAKSRMTETIMPPNVLKSCRLSTCRRWLRIPAANRSRRAQDLRRGNVSRGDRGRINAGRGLYAGSGGGKGKEINDLQGEAVLKRDRLRERR
jgi:NAD(P)-dependent dehydrogenase (short-subunit alcohol dehydrogenase family)